jgi:hypothetical protein
MPAAASCAEVGERIDDHGRATRRGRHHANAVAPAALRDGHAQEQRQAFDQALERVGPCNAAGLEKHVGDIVFAGERAGVRDRKLARGGRAPELVGDDRFAARGRRNREAAQGFGVPHGLEEQHVAVDAGIIERCRADLAEREIDLVADGNEAGKGYAARLAPRHERPDEVAAVRGGKDAPGR